MELKDVQKELKDSIAPVMTAFEEFKATNDANLKQRDVVLEEKLGKINTTLNQYEGINQKLTLAEANKKALDDLAANVDKIEATLKRVATGDGGNTTETERKTLVKEWAHAVVAAHTTGVANLTDGQRKAIETVRAEYKALSVGNDTTAGYLAPFEYVREIIKSIILMSPVRTVASVRQTAMKSIEIPARTGVFAAQWVAEQGTKSETTGLAYGLKEIPTAELYALIDISNQMMEDSAFDMQSEITSESADQFAVAEGAAFVNGNGVGKPEGYMTNASVAYTAQGEAATLTNADPLLTLKHAIKTGYAAGAIWVMNRTTLGAVRKLKDGEGNYLWMPGIANAAPNSIDGDSYVEMPDMPDIGAGLYPIAYGNFKRAYIWVDRIALEMLRDPYTQATSGNVRFILRKRVGGQVVLPEAIRKLKIAVS